MTDDEILGDLESFNSAMIRFKETVDGKNFEEMPIALNQSLTVLKHIIQTHRLIDSIDVLESAAKLIHLLQDVHHSDKSKYDPQPFSQAIDQLALCLTARVTNQLVLPLRKVSSNEFQAQEATTNEILQILMNRTDGVDVAHEYARQLSKYIFSLIHYVQERSVEELEHVERSLKSINNCSLPSLFNSYPHLPGIELVSKLLRNENKQQSKRQNVWLLLQTHEFVGKLDSWRSYHDNIRKTVKIQWDKSLKKFQQTNQTLDESRSNSKSVVQLTPGSPTSTNLTETMLTTNFGHVSLQRTSSSPPAVNNSSLTVTNTVVQPNESNVQTDVRRQELQQTKQETLIVLNKLIFNTEQVVVDALKNFVRLNESLVFPTFDSTSRFTGEFVSSYKNFVQSLPPCQNQGENSSNNDNSLSKIPIVIELCCRAIERLEGHKIKGIYRLSGVKSKVDHLCRQFVEEKDLNENDLTEQYSAIVLGNAVKKYLRELPVALLLIVDSSSSSSSIQNELLNIGKEIHSASTTNLNKINERLRQIFEQNLIGDARLALVHLLKHLNFISLSESENQMSAANLGIVFGPTLFKSQQKLQDDSTLSTLLEAPYQAKLIEYLILNVNDLFQSEI